MVTYDTFHRRAKVELYGLHKGGLSIVRVENAFSARPDTSIQ